MIDCMTSDAALGTFHLLLRHGPSGLAANRSLSPARVTRQFHKMHGLGNDFVILDGRTEAVTMTPELARALADRQTGIGCDQLILLEPSTVADVKMRIWNHDGGEVQSCGNASRCVVALTGAKTLETGGGIVEGASKGSEVEVSLPAPKFGWDDIPLSYPMDTAQHAARLGAAGASDGAQRRQSACGVLRPRRNGDRARPARAQHRA